MVTKSDYQGKFIKKLKVRNEIIEDLSLHYTYGTNGRYATWNT